MKINDLVSICIPVYNEEKYIEKCISSVLNQTYSNVEVVILDDGSTDNTALIINEYKDKRLVYIKNEKNLGWRLNVKKCYESAKGSFLILLPADDFLTKDFVKKALEMYEKYENLGIFSCGSLIVDTDGKVTGLSQPQKIGLIKNDIFFRYIYNMQDVSAPAQVMIKRKCFDMVDGYNCYNNDRYKQFPEINLYLKIASAGFDAFQSDEKLSIRSNRPESLTTMYGNHAFLVKDNYNILYEYSQHPILNDDIIRHTNELIALSVFKKIRNNLLVFNFSEIIKLVVLFFQQDMLLRNVNFLNKAIRINSLLIKLLVIKIR